MRVDVANAGHPPPLLLREGTIRELGAPSPLLGRFRSASYASASIELKPADRILAYTDGIVEARNARGEEFGEERLHALLRSGATLSEFVEAVQAWRGGRSDVDDVTLVAIEVA
jgi:phosphoserine phosphatase RsbU/P